MPFDSAQGDALRSWEVSIEKWYKILNSTPNLDLAVKTRVEWTIARLEERRKE